MDGPAPILLISDDPSRATGLGRITRDLATVLSTMPEFRVGTLGLGGTGSMRLPWCQYHMHHGEFGELSLPDVWEEFSRGGPGVVMAVWDWTRVVWLARPELAPEHLRPWLQDARARKFKFWLYMPLDATGPGDRLTAMGRETLLGVDRILVPSPWARDVVERTIGEAEGRSRGLDWFPHGLDGNVFNTNPSGDCQKVEDVPLVGCVMTNQARKYWDVAAEVSAMLVEATKGKVRLWWHADVPVREWNLYALIDDYHLGEYVDLTTPPADDTWMAERYRACSCTLLPSGGEGWGYPAFESLACGTPCVVGAYAATASIYRTCSLDSLLVDPVAWRMEGQTNVVRPIFPSLAWFNRVMNVLSGETTIPRGCVEHLVWKKIGPRWKKWFREGL